MGRQIIKQPEGDLYAVWSSICDDFIYTDLTKQEIIDVFIEEATEQINEEVEKEIAQLYAGKRFPSTKSWEEAVKRRKEVHGKERTD